MRARLTLISLLALTACGARSDLEVGDGAPPDDVPDAAFLVTFPCRWSLGLELELTPSPAGTFDGAVPEGLERALVAWSDPATAGALIGLSAAPTRLADARVESRVTPMAGDGEFLLVERDACAVYGLDRDLVPSVARIRVAPGERCDPFQTEAGRLALRGSGVSHRYRASGTRLDVLPITPPPGGVLLDLPERGLLATHPRGSRTLLERASPDPASIELGFGPVWGLAHDRVRDAVILVHEDERDGPVVDRVRFEGTLRLERVVALPARPVGSAQTNETELLVPLADGTLAFVPLARERLERTEPFASPPPEVAKLVLRPGGSAGGLLYERGGWLVFRALVCNR